MSKSQISLSLSQGHGQKNLFGGATYDINLLAYTNFYKLAQTQKFIHTYKSGY